LRFHNFIFPSLGFHNFIFPSLGFDFDHRKAQVVLIKDQIDHSIS
jgi:hypothetical protein